MKYTWIKEHISQFPVENMCNVLKVSTSGYYSFCSRKPSDVSLKIQNLESDVLKKYEDSKKKYGYRKIYMDIAEESKIACCQETVRRIMRKLGISAKRSRRFIKTTDSNHSYNVADNLLNRDFDADKPNQKWVADITYIPTQQGWLYLAAVLDLFGRKLVGWAVSDKIDRNLVIAALNNAISNRRPGKGLMHHSDRGSQYACDDYQKLLARMDMVCSMSRKGNCWDNAVMERFFASLKSEWVNDKVYANRQEAKKDLFLYIEWFYNRKRRHAALDYMTPEEFERNYYREYKVA